MRPAAVFSVLCVALFLANVAKYEKFLRPIVRADGTNNGAWFKDRHRWVQNEDTGGKLPGHVDSRRFTEMISAEKRPATSSTSRTAAPIRPADALRSAPDRHARYSRAAGGDDQEPGGPSLSD